MSDDTKNKPVNCPICEKQFAFTDIEGHVNKCIFLNCEQETDKQKRKRSPSPVLHNTQPRLSINKKSPRDKTPPPPKHKDYATKTLAPMFQSKVSRASTSYNHEDATIIKEVTQGGAKEMSFSVPLAKQVQPKTLDDFFGQNHVLGKNTVLRTLLEKGNIPNMILWGPPGCGKTSLSSVVQEICKNDPKKLKFISLCAATCGVKDVQNLVTTAKNERKFGKQTILFMDEIHRFNKRQQDTFLLCVERGDIILIGATTENPSFSINSALLSRCRVIVMEKLDAENLYAILERAAENLHVRVVHTDMSDTEINNYSLQIENDALKWLADISDGDARIALSNLQLTMQHCNGFEKTITIDDIREGIKKSHMLYDRAGEEHYNIISAMHKSIRGSDENAALYWTTRMIVSGENPLYVARRLVRAASEDIGNADPNALQLAVATMQGCQLLGMPESDVLLAQCAIYLARAPKSREADSALAKAKQVIAQCKGLQPAVPMHIRNAPTRLMKDLGYGKLQDGQEFIFMPKELKHVNFFK